MRKMIFTFVALFAGILSAQQEIPKYKNTNLTVEERVADLVSRMTLEEKISQMSHLAPAIPRLGVIAYEPNFFNPLTEEYQEFDKSEIERYKKERPWENYQYWEQGNCLDGGWWSEALHGVARAGLATVFPQSIGLGSMWDPELVQKAADAASTEARIHNLIYGKKLIYWSPTINILRDPRWGRFEESYSEDPFLLSRMAVAFVKGFQGDDPKYLKAIATVKHFVANNSEFNRHTGSSDISERFLREYYLQAFRAAVIDGGVGSIMGAYNSINGVPATANKWLMTDVLRNEWDFKGYVVSDCGAISDIVHQHFYEENPEKAVALAVKAGTELECETCETEQFMYDKYLPGAVKKGYITENYIDRAVSRLFRARFLLGEFDPPENVKYNAIQDSELDSPEHRALALKAARESIVLLKNEKGALPLNKGKIKSVAVIGPNADRAEFGGYSGTPSFSITPFEGIMAKVGGERVEYSLGCKVDSELPGGIERAVETARRSSAVILVLGTNLDLANEGRDRKYIGLPETQIKLAKAVYAANENTIVVLINGNSLAVNWLDKNVPAIVEAWFPGQSGGEAIADVLFGDFNPGGKLPVTFYKSADQLPPIDDYDITKGRTYWFFEGDPLYKFGHGLSYTTFKYSGLKLPDKVETGKDVELSVEIKNTGSLDGDEVVEVYVKDVDASEIVANIKLQQFKRIHLKAGEMRTVNFVLNPKQFAFVKNSNQWTVEPGKFIISAGGRQPETNELKPGIYSNLSVGQITMIGNEKIIK